MSQWCILIQKMNDCIYGCTDEDIIISPPIYIFSVLGQRLFTENNKTCLFTRHRILTTSRIPAQV